jgi:Flp pilus assembly pilin Flp
MRNLFTRMWADDNGIVTLEYLILATVLGLGLIVGVTALSAGLNSELTELSNAITGLSQAYETDSFSNCCSYKQGSKVTDKPGHIGMSHGDKYTTSDVNVSICGDDDDGGKKGKNDHDRDDKH